MLRPKLAKGGILLLDFEDGMHKFEPPKNFGMCKAAASEDGGDSRVSDAGNIAL